MVSRVGKEILSKTIKSSEYQNKIKEEREMWKLWEKNKSQKRRKVMDESRGKESSDEEITVIKGKGNYWMRKLIETEAKEPNRWDHSGYKELYPEEYGDSCDSDSDSDESISDPKQKTCDVKKRKKHHKKKKKSKKIKKIKKKRCK